jgi:preprotein translocase subunit SecY
LITAAALVIARLGFHVPIPGVDLSGMIGLQPSFGGIFVFPGGSPPLPPRISIFALGLAPYISASVLLLLLSGLIQPLRRLRDGVWSARMRFDRWILVLTAVIALIQSYGTATFIRNLLAEWGLAGTIPLFFPVAVLTLTCSALFLVWLAQLITRHGIGNGVILIIVSTIVIDLLRGIVHQIEMPLIPDAPIGQTVLFLIFTLAWISAFVLFAQARGTLVFERAAGAEKPAEPLSVPLRVNIAGVLPIVAAQTVCQFPYTLGWLTGSPVFYADPLGPLYWISVCVFIVLFAYLFSAWIFNARDLLARAGRFGFTLAGAEPAEAAAARIERRVTITTLPAALALCALALAPMGLFELAGIQYSLTMHYGQRLLVLIVVSIALFRDVRARPFAMEQDWVPLAVFETALEAQMAQALLDEQEIDSEPQDRRVIPLTGSLAPWEICRPSVPSLVVHRRLGGGAVTLWVPGAEREAAARILAPVIAADDAT